MILSVKNKGLFIVMKVSVFTVFWSWPSRWQHKPTAAICEAIVMWRSLSLYVAFPVSLNRNDSAVSAGFINALWIIEFVKLEIADGTQKLSFVLTSQIAFYSLMGTLPIKAQFTASRGSCKDVALLFFFSFFFLNDDVYLGWSADACLHICNFSYLGFTSFSNDPFPVSQYIYIYIFKCHKWGIFSH